MEPYFDWLIRVCGHGTTDFEGTAAEAEKARRAAQARHHAPALLWRADLARESDRLTAQIAAAFDRGDPVHPQLFTARAKALAAEAQTTTERQTA